MDSQDSTASCTRQRIVWGLFVLALAIGWALSSVGVITTEFWRFVGPVALLAVAATMLWPARGNT